MSEIYRPRTDSENAESVYRSYRNGAVIGESRVSHVLGDDSLIWYNVPGGNFCNHYTNSHHTEPHVGFWVDADYNPDNILERSWISYEGLTDKAGRAPLPDVPSRVAELLARTNPSRPVVSVPNFVYELREFPDMLKGKGLEILSSRDPTGLNWRAPANAYLSGKFGWAPLIGDALKMRELQSSLKQRTKRLNRTHGSHAPSGKVIYGEVTNTVINRDVNMVYARGDIVTTSTHKHWGSCKWRATSLFPDNPAADAAIAAASYLGLTDPLTDFWMGIPWTWMADWFGNFTDFVQAYGNNFFVHPDEILSHWRWLDHTADVNVKAHRNDNPRTSTSAGHGEAYKMTYLRRLAGPPLLSAHLPVMTDNQVATAVALLGQRSL